MWRSLVSSTKTYSTASKFKEKPNASEVLTRYLLQRDLPPWTSYFVKCNDIINDQRGFSHFNWAVKDKNYHILRTGCYPYIKYHCTCHPHEDLSAEDSLFRIIKIMNLGLPCLAYGIAAEFLISHREIVETSKVIVRVIRGENFPANEGELRFKVFWGDDEAIMEPVCCAKNVVINQEVAFLTSELDERISNMENLSLLCTHVSSDGTLFDFDPTDLSFYVKSKSSEKWYKCTSSSISSVKAKAPSLLISIFGESTEETTPKEALATNQRDGLKLVTPKTEALKERQLRPVLINDEYFLIQDPNDTSEQILFNMSVTISFAENLLYLFPSKSLWPSENIPFEFRFSLFGSPIRFQPFNCLRNLTEIGERATAKLKGSPECILRFLKQSMQALSIMLFCEDIPIAEAIIPIKERIEHYQLERRILEKLHLEPINISGIFPISSLLEVDLNEMNSGFTTPQIGVVVTLSEAEPKTATQLANQTNTAPTPPSIQSSIVSSETVKTCSEKVRISSKKHRRSQGKTQETEESLVYAAALELEVWKEEQKLLEKERQERTRASYLELLNSEYRRQAAIKEAAFQRRVHHVEELEKQLENAIQNTRQVELNLQQEKEQLNKQRTKLAREKSAVASEVEQVTQSLTTKHKFELEAEKRRHTDIVTDLRRKLKFQQQKSSDDSTRISDLEQELNSLRQIKK